MFFAQPNHHLRLQFIAKCDQLLGVAFGCATHLHHALDACVLGLAADRFPRRGEIWRALIERRPSPAQRLELETLGLGEFESTGGFRLHDLPESIKIQLRQRLAERRVVQHVPADMSGTPVSLLLPACRSSDTLLTRRHLSLPETTRRRLWEKTIDAKCANQLAIANRIAPESVATRNLTRASAARTARKEGGCAKIFWDVFSEGLRIEGFARGRKLGGLNDLLNYGYAVLLSTVLQKLYGFGLDPTVGISHAIRERSAPLAYDLMEPFRPCVDWRIYQWVKDRPEAEVLTVTTEFRRWVTGFTLERVDYLGLELDLPGCIEGVVRSFRQAVISESTRSYRPWMLKNSKWAGLS